MNLKKQLSQIALGEDSTRKIKNPAASSEVF